MFGYDVNRHKVLGTSTGTSSFEFVFAPTYFSNTKSEFKKMTEIKYLYYISRKTKIIAFGILLTVMGIHQVNF